MPDRIYSNSDRRVQRIAEFISARTHARAISYARGDVRRRSICRQGRSIVDRDLCRFSHLTETLIVPCISRTRDIGESTASRPVNRLNPCALSIDLHDPAFVNATLGRISRENGKSLPYAFRHVPRHRSIRSSENQIIYSRVIYSLPRPSPAPKERKPLFPDVSRVAS